MCGNGLTPLDVKITLKFKKEVPFFVIGDIVTDTDVEPELAVQGILLLLI